MNLYLRRYYALTNDITHIFLMMMHPALLIFFIIIGVFVAGFITWCVPYSLTKCCGFCENRTSTDFDPQEPECTETV